MNMRPMPAFLPYAMPLLYTLGRAANDELFGEFRGFALYYVNIHAREGDGAMEMTASRPTMTFTFLELLDRTFRIYRDNFATLIGLVALVTIPLSIVNLILTVPTLAATAELSTFGSRANAFAAYVHRLFGGSHFHNHRAAPVRTYQRAHHLHWLRKPDGAQGLDG